MGVWECELREKDFKGIGNIGNTREKPYEE